jgi:nucleoside-diphosphate-sugar epimerase
MTYVITGARGYIGTALVKTLAGQGRALRLVSRLVSPSDYRAASAAIEYVRADLRHQESWRALLEGAGAVVHLSWRSDLRAAEADPASDHVVNVEPVRALVRAAERSGVAIPVIFASSTSIAGAVHVNPINEETPDRPCSVYDSHKLECEVMLGDATRRDVLSACSLRLPTVYGYGSGISSINPNRGILNMMVQRAARGEALTIYGDGKYIRDFVFVGDVVDAFCRALSSARVQDGNHYVIGTGHGYSLAEAFGCVAQEAYRATARKVEVRHVPEPSDLHPIERSDFVGDSGLFQKLTGWRPNVNLESGIRDYFERLVSTNSGVSP